MCTHTRTTTIDQESYYTRSTKEQLSMQESASKARVAKTRALHSSIAPLSHARARAPPPAAQHTRTHTVTRTHTQTQASMSKSSAAHMEHF